MALEEWNAVWTAFRERSAAALRHPLARWVVGGAALGLLVGFLTLLYARAPVALDEETEKVTFFQIGTGASDGPYFGVGGRLAAIVSRPPDVTRCEPSGPCGVEGLLAVVKSSAGSVANIRAVNAGHFDSALVQSTTLDQAYRGSGSFKGEKPFTDLRAIASVYDEAVHLVARSGSGIRSVADLKGKRVSVGGKGSGTALLALDLLHAYGLTTRSVDVTREEPARSAELLLGGELDAFFLVAAAPSDIVTGLANRNAVELVPIDGTPAEKIISARRQFRVFHMAGGTYKLLPAVDTLGLSAVWICNRRADPELIHAIAEALFYAGNRELLPMADEIPMPRKPDKALEEEVRRRLMMNATANLPIPLHEGAARFYREEGVLPPD